MRIVKCLFPALLISTLFSSLSYAVAPDRISGVLSSGATVPLRGNVHHKALPKYDQGSAAPSLKFGYVTLLTLPSPSQRKALTEFVAQQQDRKSPNYHKWLTPEQWADRFGLSAGDIQKITAWLKSQGFVVGNVARGRNWITFSGTAAQIQKAFGTEIHRYNVDGEMHVANATAPKIPAALSGIVSSLRGLDDFHLKPHARRPRPNYYDGTFPRPDFLAPGDIATIYDINTLYSGGIDGTGQKLAVIGQTDIFLADLNDFRSAFGLTPIAGCTSNATTGLVTACNASNFQYVLVPNASDPGAASFGDLTETDLDLEWSGAVARNAKIVFVNAPIVFDSSGNYVSGGVFDAWYYAVDNNLAPVISLSYGNCEFDDNNVVDPVTGLAGADEVELMKANSEGITFFNSSGDNGAAECDFTGRGGTLTSTNQATQGLAVSYPASSPEVTGIGGTAISMSSFTPTYWGTANGTDGGSALSYIPEIAWNDIDEFYQFCLANSTNLFCTQGGTTAKSGWVPITTVAAAQTDIGILSSGGGVSNCALQDSDNASCVSGFPQPSWQTVVVPNQASVRFTPDVSLFASPDFPGFIFCTPQKAWVPNSTNTASTCVNGVSGSTGALEAYTSIVGGTSASTPVFAGIMTLMNQYLASPPGQGNINPTLYTLAATPANAAFHAVTTSDNNVYCEVGTPGGTNTDPWPSALQCPAAGVFGFNASNFDATSNYNLVTGLGSVDANNLAVSWKALATQPGFTLSPISTSLTGVTGQSTNSITITIIPLNGFTGTVTFTCSSGLPTGATCTFTPVNATSSTLVIQAPATAVQNASIIVTGTASGVPSNYTAVTLTATSPNQSFTIASTAPSYQVAQGSSVTATVKLTPANGFSSPVTYTCTDAAPQSTCVGPVNAIASTTTASFLVSTTPPTGASLRPLDRPFDRRMRIFYAVLLPGLLGIVFTVGSRRRSVRKLRMLGLLLSLGFSTLWLGSCGGNNSTNRTGGTPKGSYTITVNASTGGSSAITSQTTFTLQVQ